MKSFKNFIKEQAQPVALDPSKAVKGVFEFFTYFSDKYQKSSDDERKPFKEDQGKVEILKTFDLALKTLNDNTNVTKEYLKDPNNKEYVVKSIDDIIFVLKDIFGSDTSIALTLQMLEDMKNKLQKKDVTTDTDATATDVAKPSQRLQDAMGALGLE